MSNHLCVAWQQNCSRIWSSGMLVSKGCIFHIPLHKHAQMKFSKGSCDFEAAVCGPEPDLLTNIKL
jgi:hypothetical protein